MTKEQFDKLIKTLDEIAQVIAVSTISIAILISMIGLTLVSLLQ